MVIATHVTRFKVGKDSIYHATRWSLIPYHHTASEANQLHSVSSNTVNIQPLAQSCMDYLPIAWKSRSAYSLTPW